MRKKGLIAIIVLQLIFVFGVFNTLASDGEVWISVAGPFTGDAAMYGSYFKKGAETAAEWVNDQGGIKNKTLKIQFEDDKLSPQESSMVASKLCRATKILAVVGHISSTQNLAAIPIYQKCSLVTINASATLPKLSGISPFWFRNVVSEDYMNEVLVKYAISEFKPKSTAILYLVSDAFISGAEKFKKTMEKNGIKVVAFESHQPNEKDFVATLTKVQPLNPDLMFIMTTYPEAAMIMKQAREMGIKSQFIGPEPLYSPKLPELGGSATDGTVSVGYFHVQMASDNTKEFIKRYKQKFNEEPELYGMAIADSVLLAAEAFKKYGANREAPKKYLESLGIQNPFLGIAGPISFDKNHDLLPKPLALVKVENGKWVFIRASEL